MSKDDHNKAAEHHEHVQVHDLAEMGLVARMDDPVHDQERSPILHCVAHATEKRERIQRS